MYGINESDLMPLGWTEYEMAKKRQSDFQKTTLKVGRSISTRRNVTNTSFKAKKISIPGKKSRPIAEKTFAEILSHVRNPSFTTKQKLNHLQELLGVVQGQEEALRHNLCEVLDSALTLVIDADPRVKKVCMGILLEAFRVTEDAHLRSYVKRITTTIVCLLKGSSPSKHCGLTLLDGILEHHPNIIMHSMPILNCLSGLASSLQRTHSHLTSPAASSSQPIVVENVYSQKFSINVLGYMCTYLRKFLEMVTTEEEPDPLEGYFDGEEMVWTRVPKRFDPEKAYLKELKNPRFDDSGQIEEFIHDFINVLVPIAFNEEIPGTKRGNDQLLPSDAAKNLSILFEAFSYVGEWSKLIAYTKDDDVARKFLVDNVFNGKRFPFFTTQVARGTPQFAQCVKLNLTLCYLCAVYLIKPGDNNGEYTEIIFSYLKGVLVKSEKVMPYETKYQCIPVIIKLLKVYLNMIDQPEDEPELVDCLSFCIEHLCSLVNKNDSRENHKLLVFYLMKLCGDPLLYKFVYRCDGLKLFYSWLLTELREKRGRLDKKYFETIKRVSSFEYPAFYQVFHSLGFATLKSLLKSDNEDVRDTTIVMIHHMEEIADNLLEFLTRIILLEKSFPKSHAIKLVHRLHSRFLNKPSNEKEKESSIYSSTGFVNITMFLTNLALDVHNLEKFSASELKKEFLEDLNHLHDARYYDLIPSIQWTEHESLFKVVLKCLQQVPLRSSVCEIVISLINDIMDRREIPMHIAIAILRLDRELLKMVGNDAFRARMFHLTYSALLTLSVLSGSKKIKDKDDWYYVNVNVLFDSMSLTSDQVSQLLDYWCKMSYGSDARFIFYILKIIKIFWNKDLIDAKWNKQMLHVLNCLKDACKEKNICQQPLFVSLEEIFTFEASTVPIHSADPQSITIIA